ncbi:MAG: hypothetical protein ACN4GM_13295 [Gammaproteobacteria bacterium]
METIKLSNKDVTVKELKAMESKAISREVLLDIGVILDAYNDWDKSTFELAIKNPKLFFGLIAKSTGLTKKQIRKMKSKDCDVLIFTFLSVNSEFFIQRLKLISMAS